VTGTVIGGAAGFALAVVTLAFGFWGFLAAVVFGAVGAFIGALVTGRVDVRTLGDAFRGRRSAL
jgi:uncharacterized membrane protein